MRIRAAIVFALCADVTLVACGSKVLSNGGADGGPSTSPAPAEDAGLGPLPTNPSDDAAPSSSSSSSGGNVVHFDASAFAVPGVDAIAPIMDLDDAQANALCAWLGQDQTHEFPGPCGDSLEGGGGYVTGATTSQAPPSPGQPSFYRVCLDQSYCVANLRQSPCTSIAASLVLCVKAFDTGNETVLIVDCNAFEADPACHSTVLGYDETSCIGLLPIVSDASCQ